MTLRLITLLLLFSFHCYSQKIKDSLKVRLDVPAVIEQRDQFNLAVAFRNLYHRPVRVVTTPEFTSCLVQMSDIRVQVQQVDSGGCYRDVELGEVDFPPPLEEKIAMTDLALGDSLSHHFDIGICYSLFRGAYRVKALVWYSIAGKWSHSDSDWQYFQVRTDIYRRR